jgi:hypothetical protein
VVMKAKRTPTKKRRSSKRAKASTGGAGSKKRRPSLTSVARPPVTDTSLVDDSSETSNGKRSTQAVSKFLNTGNYRRISRATKFTPQHVGRVLKGTKGTTLDGAALIAVAAGVTIDELHAYVVRARERGRREARERLDAIRPVKPSKVVEVEAP